MKHLEEGMLLRVFVGEADRWHGSPLYEQIVLRAKEMGLAGATVLRGVMGFGAHSRLHTTKVLRLSEDLPLVVEIVDSRENIDKLLPFLEETVEEGLITLKAIDVIRHRSGRPTDSRHDPSTSAP